MKRAFTLYGKLIDGELYFEYDADGVISSFECRSDMNDKQLDWLSKNFPSTMKQLDWLVENSSLKLNEMPQDLDFETFYKLYGFARARYRAEPFWSKMSKQKKQDAMSFVIRYKERCKRDGISLKHPDQYLKQEPWND